MDPESKQLLEKTYTLVEENNKMLHKIRNLQKLASLMRVFYWLVIIAITFGSYYLLQPYVDQLQKVMQNSGTNLEQLKNIGNYLPKK